MGVTGLSRQHVNWHLPQYPSKDTILICALGVRFLQSANTFQSCLGVRLWDSHLSLDALLSESAVLARHPGKQRLQRVDSTACILRLFVSGLPHWLCLCGRPFSTILPMWSEDVMKENMLAKWIYFYNI